MQRDLLTECHPPELELKNPQNVILKESNEPGSALQENNDHVKNCAIKSLHCRSEMPSMVSEFAEINSAVPNNIKNIDATNKQFILTSPLILVDNSLKNGNKIINVNSGILQFPTKSPKLNERPVAHQLITTVNNNSANNATKIGSLSLKSWSNVNICNNRNPTAVISNDSNKAKPPLTVVLLKPNEKPQVQPKPDANVNSANSGESPPVNSNAKYFKIRPKNITELQEPRLVAQNATSPSEPFCVISEVIGNANAAFSSVADSNEREPGVVGSSEPRLIILKKPPVVRNQQTDSSAFEGNDPGEIGKGVEETPEVIHGETAPGFPEPEIHEENSVEILETETDPSCETKEKEVADADEAKHEDVQKTPTEVIPKENPVEKSSDALSGPNDEIQEITVESSTAATAAADKTQPESGSSGSVETPTAEVQLITPKKTNDITKIKGWRRKQFLVEKPTTVEFYRIEKGSKQKRIRIGEDSEFQVPETNPPEPGKVENAFVCDSLDEFLDGEVDLKVGYEIPHLYAEIGIRLTSEDIASKPNLSDKDFKEVESRYCIPVEGMNDIVNLDEIEEDSFKSRKRRTEDDNPKPFKFMKLQECKRQSSILQKPAEKSRNEWKKENVMLVGEQELSKGNRTCLKVFDRYIESVNNVRLESKLLGLVVYPGPFRPLHPIVRHHLDKLRSYSTSIDKNWADFAASAVFDNEKHYKRRILPVHCCVKTENHAKEINGASSILKKEFLARTESPTSTNRNRGRVKLKKCHVVIDKIDLVEPLSPWCMDHHTYDCEPCGLSKTKLGDLKSLVPRVMHTDRNAENKDREPVVPPQASFDGRIANLLARKLRILKFRGDTLTSINCLKKLVPDSVEFIKLNFVKESFLSAYISIWFLKQENPWTRSRAFLTFSQTPPMPNAVNLRSDALSVKNLPKVITEIVSSDNVFSPNEYAILHCNGEIWEIHGSLNIAFGKSDKNVEQIFASLYLPELRHLQKVGQKILRVRAFKWWVVDLSQKFKLIEIKFGNVISVVSRNKFLESARYDSHGFIPIRRNSNGRILGAYVIRPLLPFVLMGPYYLLETHNMTLKGERSTLPFMYFVKENVMKDSPLKFFINSVIKDVKENDKVLDGLWLYDKMRLDRTSYIEVLTRNLASPVLSKYASIDIDHGYSLSSLTNCLPPGVSGGTVKRKDGQEDLKKVTVYLYFDVFELGYVEGELQRDNSVIICHPLDRRTKVKSHRVGDWFMRTIRRRIEFIPKDLEVKWFITKHKDDLRERRPFNKFLLGGAHVLTKKGIFYLLEMSESKIAKLGLGKNEVAKAIMESQVIKVVLEMKKLASLLSGSARESSSMSKVLTAAISEIERLRSFGECLEKEKAKAEEDKQTLLSSFLQTLNSCQANDHYRLKMIENVERFFTRKDGEFTEEFVEKLKKTRIGRKYFKWSGKCSYFGKKVRETNNGDAHAKAPKNSRKKCRKLQFLLSSIKQPDLQKADAFGKMSPVPENKSPKLSDGGNTPGEVPPEFPSPLAQQRPFDSASVPVNRSDRNPSPERPVPTKDGQKENPKRKKAKRKKSAAAEEEDSRNGIAMKSDGFLKLTSPGLPENIKLCWRNTKR